MFRMLQALEREPVNLATQTSKAGPLVREMSVVLVYNHVKLVNFSHVWFRNSPHRERIQALFDNVIVYL